jgi:hypothetical protein
MRAFVFDRHRETSSFNQNLAKRPAASEFHFQFLCRFPYWPLGNADRQNKDGNPENATSLRRCRQDRSRDSEGRKSFPAAPENRCRGFTPAGFC